MGRSRADEASVRRDTDSRTCTGMVEIKVRGAAHSFDLHLTLPEGAQKVDVQA